MTGSVVGHSDGLSKQPSALPSMKQVTSTKQMVAVVVEQVTLGYSSESGKRRLDPN